MANEPRRPLRPPEHRNVLRAGAGSRGYSVVATAILRSVCLSTAIASATERLAIDSHPLVKEVTAESAQDCQVSAETLWLKHQIVFEQEPLELVVAEFNRYAPKPIKIDTPTLRNLQISGVIATDDPEAFVAFLRSLDGVHVEVGAAAVRVSKR